MWMILSLSAFPSSILSPAPLVPAYDVTPQTPVPTVNSFDPVADYWPELDQICRLASCRAIIEGLRFRLVVSPTTPNGIPDGKLFLEEMRGKAIAFPKRPALHGNGQSKVRQVRAVIRPKPLGLHLRYLPRELDQARLHFADKRAD